MTPDISQKLSSTHYKFYNPKKEAYTQSINPPGATNSHSNLPISNPNIAPINKPINKIIKIVDDSNKFGPIHE